jgi:hypothetical protein
VAQPPTPAGRGLLVAGIERLDHEILDADVGQRLEGGAGQTQMRLGSRNRLRASLPYPAGSPTWSGPARFQIRPADVTSRDQTPPFFAKKGFGAGAVTLIRAAPAEAPFLSGRAAALARWSCLKNARFCYTSL